MSPKTGLGRGDCVAQLVVWGETEAQKGWMSRKPCCKLCLAKACPRPSL